MRSTFAALSFGFLIAAVSVTSARSAGAEEQFDVQVAGGKVTVVTKGNWHINQDYPWKLVTGDAKLGKDKFELGEKTASLSGAPKGHSKLKGAICSGDECKTFDKEIDVP